MTLTRARTRMLKWILYSWLVFLFFLSLRNRNRPAGCAMYRQPRRTLSSHRRQDLHVWDGLHLHHAARTLGALWRHRGRPPPGGSTARRHCRSHYRSESPGGASGGPCGRGDLWRKGHAEDVGVSPRNTADCHRSTALCKYATQKIDVSLIMYVFSQDTKIRMNWDGRFQDFKTHSFTLNLLEVYLTMVTC